MNSDDPNTHIVNATKQGGDMVNCLAVWDNLLVSGGDGGQLLLRFLTFAILLLKPCKMTSLKANVEECELRRGGSKPERSPGRLRNLRSRRLLTRALVGLL